MSELAEQGLLVDLFVGIAVITVLLGLAVALVIKWWL